MNAPQVAAALTEIGTLLELQGENPFQSQAYHTAARAHRNARRRPAGPGRGRASSTRVRGIGETLREKITALVTDGQLPLLDELRAKTPPGLMQMLRIPGLGPKKVKALHEHGINDLEALQRAVRGRHASPS